MDMLFFASGSSMWVCETERETAPLMLCWNLPETVQINCLISIQCPHTITHSGYRVSNRPEDTEIMEPSVPSLHTLLPPHKSHQQIKSSELISPWKRKGKEQTPKPPKSQPQQII